MTDLWLDPIPEWLHAEAAQRFAEGDVLGFLRLADNLSSLHLVAFNQPHLLDRGIYEAALLHALTATRVNNRPWSASALSILVGRADPARLRAAGDPLPGPGPFTVFRGVAGRGRSRMVRGISWTLSLSVAAWFANRWARPDPAVYSMTVESAQVLAYVHEGGREEAEVLIMPTSVLKPRRHLDGPRLAELAEERSETVRRENEERLERLETRWAEMHQAPKS